MNYKVGCHETFDIDIEGLSVSGRVGYVSFNRDGRPRETLEIYISLAISNESRDITRQISNNLRDINLPRYHARCDETLALVCTCHFVTSPPRESREVGRN